MIPRTLLKKYRAEIAPLIGSRLDFYEPGGSLRTGTLQGVSLHRQNIVYLVRCFDALHRVDFSLVRRVKSCS